MPAEIIVQKQIRKGLDADISIDIRISGDNLDECRKHFDEIFEKVGLAPGKSV